MAQKKTDQFSRLNRQRSRPKPHPKKPSDNIEKGPVAKHKPSEKETDSLTVVNFVLDEPRKSVGFKCNKKLWKAFVRFCRREFGSVCHVLEPIMLALLTQEVNLSKTIKPLKMVEIGTLNVERAVKRVRRYAVEVEEQVEVAVERGCGFCGKTPVVGAFENARSGVQKQVCSYHAANLKGHPKWLEVSSG